MHHFPRLAARPGFVGLPAAKSGQSYALTFARDLTIVPAMNGLLTICGICREIIR
jgi:hypothetical protein